MEFHESIIFTQEAVAVYKNKRGLPGSGAPSNSVRVRVELEFPPKSKLHYTRGALHAGDLTEVLGTDVNDRRWCKHVVVEQIV